MVVPVHDVGGQLDDFLRVGCRHNTVVKGGRVDNFVAFKDKPSQTVQDSLSLTR